MLERDLIELFKRSARGTPAFKVRKTHGSGHSSSEPDLTGCWDGWRFELEAKIDPSVPTLSQINAMMSWAAAGAFVGMLTYIHGTNQTWVIPMTMGRDAMIPFKDWGQEHLQKALLLDWRADDRKRLNIKPLLFVIKDHMK